MWTRYAALGDSFTEGDVPGPAGRRGRPVEKGAGGVPRHPRLVQEAAAAEPVGGAGVLSTAYVRLALRNHRMIARMPMSIWGR